MIWDNAQTYCTNNNGQLAMFDTHTDIQTIMNQCTDLCWIGVRDPDIFGDYAFIDGTLVPDQINGVPVWESDHPTRDGLCAYVMPTGSPRIRAANCNNNYYAVCETNPSSSPTNYPTNNPSSNPTKNPSINPTNNPTNIPTSNPTKNPTSNPSNNPSNNPSTNPTNDPTIDPTAYPTIDPTTDPTIDPTIDPTAYPTIDPTADPTDNPTIDPTIDPTSNPTSDPTTNPTIDPTIDPTSQPTNNPTTDPTTQPTFKPTSDPTVDPTTDPTTNPTIKPTTDPTNDPTNIPTSNPTDTPTNLPTIDPTADPTTVPTIHPKTNPIPAQTTTDPTAEPTNHPSINPTNIPTSNPTNVPTIDPTIDPTTYPTKRPTAEHTVDPAINPTTHPSTQPTTYQCADCSYNVSLIMIDNVTLQDCSTMTPTGSSDASDSGSNEQDKPWDDDTNTASDNVNRKCVGASMSNSDSVTNSDNSGNHRRLIESLWDDTNKDSRDSGENDGGFNKWYKNKHDDENKANVKHKKERRMLLNAWEGDNYSSSEDFAENKVNAEFLTEVCTRYVINALIDLNADADCGEVESVFLGLCENNQTDFNSSTIDEDDLNGLIISISPDDPQLIVNVKGVRNKKGYLGILVQFTKNHNVRIFELCLGKVTVDSNFNKEKKMIDIGDGSLRIKDGNKILEECPADGLPCLNFFFAVDSESNRVDADHYNALINEYETGNDNDTLQVLNKLDPFIKWMLIGIMCTFMILMIIFICYICFGRKNGDKKTKGNKAKRNYNTTKTYTIVAFEEKYDDGECYLNDKGKTHQKIATVDDDDDDKYASK